MPSSISSQTLTVLQVAYPFAPVSSDAVGGAEQIVAALDRALTARGHRSLVVAMRGSEVQGTLFEVPPPLGAIDDDARAEVHAATRRAIARALSSTHVDLVHLHGIDFDAYLPDGVPSLVTLHLPIAWYPPGALRRDASFVCVSESQRRTCPVDARVVENGVDLSSFRPRQAPGRYAFSLGRICPEKGFELALEAATAAEAPLVIAGRVFPYAEHLRYFESVLLPKVQPPHRFVGPVAMVRKRRLLAGASCLVVPSRAQETSSLVAMEAFAAGTPVVAFASGALGEIVEHGRTGFLAANVDEMAAAIRRVGKLSRRACRDTAEKRFGAERMIDEYLSVYQSLVRRPHRPSSIGVERISSVDGLERLAGEWAELWERTPSATMFQRPEWLLPWCRELAPPRLAVLAVRRDDRLLALLPLAGSSTGSWTLAGAGVSDYLDLLAEPSAEPVALEVLRRFLAEARGPLLASDLRADAILRRASFAGAGPEELDQRCPQVRLSSKPLLDSLPPGFAERLAYAERRAAREGFTWQDVTASTVDELLEGLFRVHGARWAQRGQSGVLADPALQRFHRRVAHRLFSSGLLVLHGLRDPRGELVGVSYGSFMRGRVCVYLTGFLPSLARYSPGMLVIARAIEQALARGAHVADYLRGAEPYKYDWGAVDEHTYRRTFVAARAPRDERSLPLGP